MNSRLAMLLGLTGAAALVPAAGAAEWTTGAGLSVGSYYSDNICRSPIDEEAKTVGTVTPSVTLSGEGSRASMNLNAAVEYNTLGESSLECTQAGIGANVVNRETWAPRVNFDGEIEALEQLVFLEANAFAAQNAINPFAAGGDDNINARGNTNITYRWGVGARIDRQFNDQWALLARYNYNEQYNSFNRALGDSQEDRVDLDLGMIPQASRLSAGISGQYSEVTFEETPTQAEFTNRLSRLELRAALQLSSSWQFNAKGGEEDNVFLSSSDEIDGSYWDVGVRWAPNERVEVNAGYGERFFGETPRLDVSYRHRRSQLTAAYQRDLQFPRDIRAGSQDPGDPFDPGIALPGDPLAGAGGPTFLGQRPVLNERFSLNYRFTARRTSFGLSASDSQQTRTLGGGKDTFQNVTATVTRSLGQTLSVDLRIGWRSNEGGGIVDPNNPFALGFEAWTAGIGLQQRLAQNITLSLRYNYTDQTSDSERNSFEENRVDLGLRFSF